MGEKQLYRATLDGTDKRAIGGGENWKNILYPESLVVDFDTDYLYFRSPG